ncbi:MAG: hypothetical protein AABZ67_06435 [Pseudomonadota bacterium]
METLYKWRVQEKDRRGRMRWRIVRSPMTEETARFWAANNDKVIERIAAPAVLQRTARPAGGNTTGCRVKAQS